MAQSKGPGEAPLITAGIIENNEGAVSFTAKSGLDKHLKFNKLADQLIRRSKYVTVIKEEKNAQCIIVSQCC